MSKSKSFYQCQSCAYTSPKWLGKCPDCGSWNSFIEEKSFVSIHRSSSAYTQGRTNPVPLNEISSLPEDRTPTGINELDRVLGGGIVAGSVILVGGDPGIGKSTLLLQAFSGLSKRAGKLLYISGEESPQQIKLRAERLMVNSEQIILLSETSLEGIIDIASRNRPDVMVVDSIQTIYTQELPSAPGSVGQVRECASRLMVFAKRTGIPVFIVGHVTKEGMIAGPRVLEHIVDTVLYFEGDRGHTYRILRTIKNRFGSTNEIGIFEMSDSGLRGVDNPSELFLSERPLNVSGSTVTSSIEGTRPLLVEIQALVSQTNFGMPRRTSIGIDFNRINLLLAVLEKRADMHLGGMDVFINVVGGIKIIEPAVDLAVVAAIASSAREKPVDPKIVLFGEVGLSGEIRAVAQAETRIKEAEKLGFKKILMPYRNAEKIRDGQGIDITGIRDIEELVEILF